MRLRPSLFLFGLTLCLATASPMVISEFVASNGGSFQDGDGESSDWIELHNTGNSPVDLTGWKLSDSDETWTFPGTTIDGGDFLLVFASGRDEQNYLDTGGFLHTTFRLDADGEEITLLRPDGTTASQFTSVSPQRQDISFGLSSKITNLIQPDSPARFFIPESPVSQSWRGGGFFDDSSWSEGAAALGFGSQNENNITTVFLVPEGVVGNQTYGGSLGMDFIVVEPVLVTELGAFDSNGDGFAAPLTTQLWRRNDGGTPGDPSDDLGISVVASSSFTPGNPGTLEGGSRFRALNSPTTLQPGSYSIVSSGFGVSDPNGNLGVAGAGDWESDDGEGALQFTGRGRFGAAGTFPANTDGGPANRYAAGTLKILPLSSAEIATDIGPVMRGTSETVLERIEFDVADPSVISLLEFQIAYDDGFTAWINGVEVANDNSPARTARRDHRAYSIPATDGLLMPGTNILAIEGRNLSENDDDFLLRPSLSAVTDGSQNARYFDEPSPGTPSRGQAFDGFVADTKFSVDRGFFSEAFDVSITTATPEARIIFTTDGSEPTLSNGKDYTNPILIDKTTVIRARAFREGYRPTDIDTQTYLFTADIARQTNAPSGYPLDWAGTSSRYGMTASTTNYARAAGNPGFSTVEAEAAIKESLASLPSLSIVTDSTNLFDPATGIYVNPSARGQAWERPVSVELIHPDNTPGFQEDAGIRMMGFSSRNISIRKLHMRLLFKNQYDSGTLRYPFFGEDRSNRINTIALRGNRRDAFIHTNNATYLGDEWAKRTQSAMGQLAPRGEFVHLYLNGLYWGVYNPTERPDDAFAEEYLGGEREDYDVVKFCCPDRSIAGDISAWNQLLGEARAGIDTQDDFQRVQGLDAPASPALLDVDSLIDYLIAGQFHGAWDWPGNYYALRDRDEDRTTGYRFFTWDNDVIFDGGNPAIANKVTPDPGHPWWTESPGEVDLGIRDNPEYRMRFADRVYQHYFHGGALSEVANLERWNELADLVRPALFAESARWGDANSALRTVQDHWDPMNNRMMGQYFPGRQAIVFNQLRNAGLYPSIDPPQFNRQGGPVAPGFGLAFTSGDVIYYTTDGTDPRLPGGAIHPDAISATSGLAVLTLVQEDAPTRALIPKDGSDGLSWTMPDYDDTAWLSGTGGVGYDNGSDYNSIIELDVRSAMLGKNESAYIRIPFPGANPEDFTSLTLKMRYDDGFIAYLNGVQIASAGAPLNREWNSRATSSTEASITRFDDFDITSFIDQLRPEGNVLAIHGLNRGVSSADFIIQPVLEGMSTTGEVALELNQSTEIKARTLADGEWSALNQTSFIVGTPASSENLVISEIFYNPPGPGEVGEFIEIYNPTSTPIDLSGVRFVAGITYEFPLNTVLEAGGRLTLGPDDYEGKLANSGEEIGLLAADESIIATFRYDDRFPWPEAADGEGYSLVYFGNDPNDPSSWRSSVAPGGTPGISDSLPFPGGDLLTYALPDPDVVFKVTGNQWTLEFTRPVNADEADFIVEVSSDLENWIDSGNLVAIEFLNEIGQTRVTYHGEISGQGNKQFARIRVILNRP